MTDLSCVSLVIPVYNEKEHAGPLFEAIEKNLGREVEILICYDFDEDNTLPVARRYQERFPDLRLVKNHYAPGPLGAIRSGFDAAMRPAVVVTMADLSDDLKAVHSMAALFREGCCVVAASRYMKGGGQEGGPFLKRLLARLAGLTLHFAAGLPVHDVTSNFRLYDRRFLQETRIQSDGGFEIALELTVKAHLSGKRVGEVPTVWRDRNYGESRFRLRKWLPKYLRWYLLALYGNWFGAEKALASA